MRRNPELEEKVEHGHYVPCSMRMTGIEHDALRLFVYTGGTGILFAILTAIAFPIGCLSWLPSLVGYPTDVGYLFLQWFEIFLMTLGAFLNYIGFKKLGFALFVIYTVMTLASFIGGIHEGLNMLMLVIGGGGLVFSFRAYGDMCDYYQLKETEGFPHFNHLLVEPPGSRTYKPRYMDEYHRTIVHDKTDKEEEFARAVEAERRKLAEASSAKPSAPPPAPAPSLGGSYSAGGMSDIDAMPGLEGISKSEPEIPEMMYFDPISCGFDIACDMPLQ